MTVKTLSINEQVLEVVQRIELFLERSHDLQTQRYFDQADREKKSGLLTEDFHRKVLGATASLEKGAERLLSDAHRLELEMLKLDREQMDVSVLVSRASDLTKGAEQMASDVKGFTDEVAKLLGGLIENVKQLNLRFDEEAVKDDEQRELEKKALSKLTEYLDEL